MFARSKGDKARSSKNNGNEREKDDSARHVHVVAAFFFVIGLLLLFGSVYLDEHQAALQPWLGHNSLQLLEHLIESIGDALIVVAIFSIALEFRDFTEYTSRILRKLLLDREYIKNLKPEEQQRLKLEVDAEILGASDLLSKGTFYRFVGSFAEDVLKMPYRREMSDLTVFSIVEGNPDLMKRTTTTRYVFVKGLSPKEQPVSVTWSASFPKIAGALGQPKICDLSVTLFKKTDSSGFL